MLQRKKDKILHVTTPELCPQTATNTVTSNKHLPFLYPSDHHLQDKVDSICTVWDAVGLDYC